MRDFVLNYSDLWLRESIESAGCTTEKEYYNKTLIQGDND